MNTPRECTQALLIYAAGLVPGGAKIRRVVHGNAVLECADQLTISIGRLSVSNSVGGATNASLVKSGGAGQNRVDYTVTWVRCYPTSEGVKVDWEKIETAALTLLDDVWPLWLGFAQGVYDGSLKALLGASRVSVTDTLPVPVQAGLAGWAFTVQAFL